MDAFDAIVIGSGQGGNPLAHKLADLDWSVALVEREHLGGTCVNYGCTPTKTMIASARAAHVARHAHRLGIEVDSVRVDLPAIVKRKNEMVRQWRNGQQEAVDARSSLELICAHARFVGPHEIEVDGRTLRSDRIIIDTGTRAGIPDVPGLADVPFLTNRTVMDLTDLPDHLIVLGGAYIGLEFGQMFERFGSRVTIVDHNDRIIAKEDADISEALQQALESEGISFVLGSSVSSASRTPSGVELALSDQTIVRGSHLLIAAGRVPNSDDLGLEAAGVATDERSFITTNDHLETNVDGIWALGDVKGGPAFTHISYDDHLVIYENLVEGGNRSMEHRIVPYALFTDPELGRVGLTERQAREAGYALKIGSIPMTRVARAKELGETDGLMKVVIDADTDQILGAAVLGVDGGEVVQILMTLMLTDTPWTTLRRATFIHPTLVEGLFALFESVED